MCCTEVSASYTAHLQYEQHILLFIISYIISYYRMSFYNFPNNVIFSFLSICYLIDARTGRDTCPVIELSLLLSGDVVSYSHFYITKNLQLQYDAQVYKLFLTEMLRYAKTLIDVQLSCNVAKRNVHIQNSFTQHNQYIQSLISQHLFSIITVSKSFYVLSTKNILTMYN